MDEKKLRENSQISDLYKRIQITKKGKHSSLKKQYEVINLLEGIHLKIKTEEEIVYDSFEEQESFSKENEQDPFKLLLGHW